MVYFYLLKIITNAIIKAIAMIVTVTNPKNSKDINCNNIISIAPPRFLTDETVQYVGGNALCLFSFSMFTSIYYFTNKCKWKMKK